MISELEELTATLASGTSRQKRRCWQRLLQDGELWRGCEEMARQPGGAESLKRIYAHLCSPWDHDPVVFSTRADPHTVEEQVRCVARIVAAAEVAALSLLPSPDPERLLEWAQRAAGEPEPGELAPGSEEQAPLEVEAWVRWSFRQVARGLPGDPVHAAAAQATSLSLLWSGQPERAFIRVSHRVRIPVLLKGAEEGHVIWLWLERLAGGFGQFFQAADTLFLPIQPDLRLALDSVWRGVRARDGWSADEDVRWWLGNLPRTVDDRGNLQPQPVEGRSIQGAAAVGLALLRRNELPRTDVVVSATLRPDFSLGPVQGIEGTSPKLRAALSLGAAGGPMTLVVSHYDRPTETNRLDWAGRGLQVVAARDLDEVVELVRQPGAGLSSPESAPAPRARRPDQRAVILCPAQPEVQRLADLLTGTLHRLGCHVTRIVRRAIEVGGLQATERTIREADLVLPLLTGEIGQSELLRYDVALALETGREHDRPRVLPVWACTPLVGGEPVAAELARLPALQWNGSSEKLASELEAVLLDPARMPPEGPHPESYPPTGAVTLTSPFYVPRETDSLLAAAVARRDSIIRIKGARQMGKSSLLARGLQGARERGVNVIVTDLQLLNDAQLTSVDTFLQALARWIVRQLNLSVSLDEVWDPLQGPSWNFREFLCYEVLERIEGPLVWGIDEVDRLFLYPFGNEVFGMFRAWHNERAISPTLPWSRLTLAMAYATEAHLFITDLNQSPFNVGTRIALEDFNLEQVAELNRRYGEPLSAEEETGRYWEVLGGHPYLSHRGLHEMVSRSRTLAELEAAADAPDSPFADHLARLLQLVLRDPDLGATVRAVLRGEPCPANDSYFRLWSAGVLSGRGPRDARLRCGLYESYLRKYLL